MNLIGFFMGCCALLIVNCGNYDDRNLPNKINVTAVASEGYHVHAQAWYHPTNPIRFFCTDLLKESHRNKIVTYNDISDGGVKIKIKKPLPGLCGYQFTVLEISCSKERTFPTYESGAPEPVNIGTLDTTKDGLNIENNMYLSGNRILDNHLFVKVNGNKGSFWGCKDDCVNKDNFGIDMANQTLNITCSEDK